MITILDFDGTVADTMTDLSVVAGRLIAEFYGLSYQEACERYWSTVGASFPEQLEELFPSVDDGLNARVADIFAEKQLGVYSTAVPTPTAKEAINVLLAEEVDVGIVSSTNRAFTYPWLERELPRIVREVELRGREDGPKASQVAELAGNGYSVTFIGDAPRDAEVATAAGVRFIGVTHTFPAEDFGSVRTAPDLRAAVREVVGA